MKSIAAVSRVKVSADGHGVVSHAGVGMLRELADLTGLSTQVTAALADTYRGPWIYEPGAVFADLAAAVADGADCIDAVGQRCGDREHVFGPAASTTTMWRPVDERIDAAHLPSVRAARASARAAAWAAGAAPAPGEWLHLDVDATITIDQSDNKENAAATWKKTWGHHSLLVFLDRPEIAGGEGLSGLLRPGNAGSNTAADHVTVLEQALESLPAAYRPDPDDPGGQQILVRSDSAGATHAFADACRTAGVGFSFGYAVDTRVRDAVELLNANDGWYPAIESGGGIRDGAWVAEATALVEMGTWPMVEKSNRAGGDVTAQVFPRPIGLILGLELTINPFTLYPTYRKIADLPLAERVAQMRKAEVRAKILADRPTDATSNPLFHLGQAWEWIFPIDDRAIYEPERTESILARARARGVSPLEEAYDRLLDDDGHAMLLGAMANFTDNSLDTVGNLIRRDDVVLGLGDGGAHYGMICDSSYPTYLLTHRARDRGTGRLSVAEAIRELTSTPDKVAGLLDRGRIDIGYKADLNIIDHAALRLHKPVITHDLPAGGRRLDQTANGYVATIVSGQVIAEHDVPNEARPGRLVRGRQPAPTGSHERG